MDLSPMFVRKRTQTSDSIYRQASNMEYDPKNPGQGMGGPPVVTGGIPGLKNDAQLPAAPVPLPMHIKAETALQDTDMADHGTRSVNQESSQITSSSPPFPRYMSRNDTATGTTASASSAEPNPRPLIMKTQGDKATALPARPAAGSAMGSSHYRPNQAAQEGPGGTSQWMHSAAGRNYLKKNQLTFPPTQLLSLECQKRKFNPDFEIKQLQGGNYNCKVTLQDVVVRQSGRYANAVAAKQDMALKALKVVQHWPIPMTNLYFIAQFTGYISEDAIHNSLRRVLRGRQYALATQRHPMLTGGYMLLKIPETQGFPTSVITLDGVYRSIAFVNVKKSDNCNLCLGKDMTPHQRIYCPLWRNSEGPGSTFDNGPRQQSFPQRPIKAEPVYNNKHGATGVQLVNAPRENKDQLIRSIQDAIGTAASSSNSRDPKVKTAFLEGIALGARLAAAAPAPDTAVKAERRRSRSPGGRGQRADYWPSSAYRGRSPLAPVRSRQVSREPMIDRGVEPPSGPWGGADSYRGHRRIPDYYGRQDASRWDNDKYWP